MRRRNALLAIGGTIAAVAIAGVKEVFDYAVAPASDKQSDFLFPADSAQEIPASLIANPKPPAITFQKLGGFVNDASHLNQTAV